MSLTSQIAHNFESSIFRVLHKPVPVIFCRGSWCAVVKACLSVPGHRSPRPRWPCAASTAALPIKLCSDCMRQSFKLSRVSCQRNPRWVCLCACVFLSQRRVTAGCDCVVAPVLCVEAVEAYWEILMCACCTGLGQGWDSDLVDFLVIYDLQRTTGICWCD